MYILTNIDTYTYNIIHSLNLGCMTASSIQERNLMIFCDKSPYAQRIEQAKRAELDSPNCGRESRVVYGMYVCMYT